ncbi:hypothetical protein [Caulobacter sp. UNC279MFTsu5.1]|uniref:hypothetical protein n=1 Tax=Caulobacter sp. UNC279MFTsu5.1 TaxID=1502775 RepID=UPI0008E3F19B|nr:hypothetical protein [Caulobacter sp. UNC279MFTsu5.1]SFK61883.1 hypothetical protein SAMN02799626_04744 [Caulobacter sp. UNC279MFTsu5.1]
MTVEEAKPARLLVLAGAWDAPARRFALQAGPGEVALATPRDLSRAGWRYEPDDPGATLALAGGEILPVAEIGCVLTRLSGVGQADLPHIAEEDRAYVAAEMTAFLLALLFGLGRPTVNRPTPQCLCGPLRSEAAWRRLALGLGLAAAPLRRSLALGRPQQIEPPPNLVTVVGKTAFGAHDRRQADAAVLLAQAADADLLTVAFDADERLAILRAHPHVDLTDAQIAREVRVFCARAAEATA